MCKSNTVTTKTLWALFSKLMVKIISQSHSHIVQLQCNYLVCRLVCWASSTVEHMTRSTFEVGCDLISRWGRSTTAALLIGCSASARGAHTAFLHSLSPRHVCSDLEHSLDGGLEKSGRVWLQTWKERELPFLVFTSALTSSYCAPYVRAYVSRCTNLKHLKIIFSWLSH